ncbi:MAG: ATP-dependent DNA helicase RecG [Gammaproteobacteria bacterium]|nr:MAG: ATP-dependent DNA helicase RecG [Gammaproteobacteria bacterium]RKZ44029.1 MAG: ATP-dependent DNA helicase RecG [Gammaproteobacteria bacterium]RKZ76696.1 MAG: ATP-dependent DNA helicase RecG [Gammaproteobacteria bacterium]
MTVPITTLQGIGERVAEQLARLKIETVEDMLFHLPLRYEDRTQIKPLTQLKVGDNVLIEGTIQATEVKITRKRSLVCMLTEGAGNVMLRFFHFYPSLREKLKPGIRLRCFGEVRQGYHCLELVHPQYECIDYSNSTALLEEHLTPIYPSTSHLNQSLFHSLIAQIFEKQEIIDYFPDTIRNQFNLLPLIEALHTLHHPSPSVSLKALQAGKHPAHRRLAFEELLAHHLSLYALRARNRNRNAPCLINDGQLTQALVTQLPFKLTTAQQKVTAEIAADLRTEHPMQRLLQGDVGSGKTIVAAISALQAIESGYQVAVMAPTELLSEQHKRTFSQWLEPLQIELTWLTSSLTKKKREQAIEKLASGQASLAIGTHALFQKGVEFAKLGLVIVDEQHRFGVHQRLALRNKGNQDGSYPHQLIMTATPIPRTLAMTTYADLETSIIDELPPGRTPVTTVIIPNTRRDEIVARINHVCQNEGRQAYWVCTLIKESEILQFQAAEETAEQLRKALPDLQIGLVHGRIKSKEKEEVMEKFKTKQLDLLVATTVIEVGVDVPNASLMIIENAERLGLAQLHQLRGRVGRGALQSYCVLLYQPPLSQIAQSRLATIRDTHDGFAIAKRDLDIRGPGEVLGTRQKGVLNLKVADLQRDKDLLDDIVAAGKILFEDYPEQCKLLVRRWAKEGLHYGEV